MPYHASLCVFFSLSRKIPAVRPKFNFTAYFTVIHHIQLHKSQLHKSIFLITILNRLSSSQTNPLHKIYPLLQLRYSIFCILLHNSLPYQISLHVSLFTLSYFTSKYASINIEKQPHDIILTTLIQSPNVLLLLTLNLFTNRI